MTADIDSKMDEHLGDMAVALDGRFSSVRTQETNLGKHSHSPHKKLHVCNFKIQHRSINNCI